MELLRGRASLTISLGPESPAGRMGWEFRACCFGHPGPGCWDVPPASFPGWRKGGQLCPDLLSGTGPTAVPPWAVQAVDRQTWCALTGRQGRGAARQSQPSSCLCRRHNRRRRRPARDAGAHPCLPVPPSRCETWPLSVLGQPHEASHTPSRAGRRSGA